MKKIQTQKNIGEEQRVGSSLKNPKQERSHLGSGVIIDIALGQFLGTIEPYMFKHEQNVLTICLGTWYAFNRQIKKPSINRLIVFLDAAELQNEAAAA